MLTSDLKEPMVSKSSMHLDLLHSLDVLSDLGVKSVRRDMHVVTLTIVLLSINVPGGYSIGKGIGNHLAEFIPLFSANFSSSLSQIDFGDLAKKISKTTAYTFNGCDGVDDKSLSFNVCVVDSDDVLKLAWILENKTLALFILP